MNAPAMEFADMRPRLKMLLELYRGAATDEARAMLIGLFEDVFLAAAWNVAVDLLDNGWEPVVTKPGGEPNPRLRLAAG